MRSIKLGILSIAASLSLSFAATVGQTAPKFSAKGHDGKTYSSENLKGKYVVLEWFNPNCPYVKKHYTTKNITKIQEDAKSKKEYPLVWLSVSSAHKDHPTYFASSDAAKIITDMKSNADAIIIDESGKIGSDFGAMATPHIFIINPEGKLIYQGGVDGGKNANSLKESSIKTAEHKYLKTVIFDRIFANKAIEKELSSTKAIGCSVKYKS